MRNANSDHTNSSLLKEPCRAREARNWRTFPRLDVELGWMREGPMLMQIEVMSRLAACPIVLSVLMRPGCEADRYSNVWK